MIGMSSGPLDLLDFNSSIILQISGSSVGLKTIEYKKGRFVVGHILFLEGFNKFKALPIFTKCAFISEATVVGLEVSLPLVSNSIVRFVSFRNNLLIVSEIFLFRNVFCSKLLLHFLYV